MRVSVLGAGNGGCSLAFHLAQMGHEVLLYQHEDFLDTILKIQKTGKIIGVQNFEKYDAAIHGVSTITKTTTDIKEAIEFSLYVILIVPSFAQSLTFKLAIPYLTEHHIVLSMPGNFAFLDYMTALKEYQEIVEASGSASGRDLLNHLTLVETSTIPYACRKINDNEIFIGGVKKLMQISVYPDTRTEQVIESIKPLFQLELVKTKNFVETGFYNLNFVLHPPITIYNAGWIDAKKGNFGFYKDGLTPSILRIIEALDKERQALAASLGFHVDDVLTAWKKWYGDTASNNLEQLVKNYKFYDFIKAPADLTNRYITEDFSYILIPLVKYIGKLNNIKTPVADALITSARCLTGLELEPARHFDAYLKEFV